MKPNRRTLSWPQPWPTALPWRQTITYLLIALPLLLSSGCAIPISGILNAQDALNNAQPGQPVIAIAPEFGAPGTVLAVAGAGWQPTDIVTIKLASALDPAALEESVTVATVGADGTFTASFAFPEEERWRIFPVVYVIAESAQTAVRANTEFEQLTDMTPTGTGTAEETAVTETTTEPTATGPTATWTPLPATATHTATPVPPVQPTATATSRPATATPPYLGPSQVSVTSGGLNVRTGPSIAYSTIRSVIRGTVLTVLAENPYNGWIQVRLADGTVGWVNGYYTTYRGTAPTAVPTNTSLPYWTPTFTPTPGATPTASIVDWRGEYFPNRYLAGSPAVVRNDPVLDFNFGNGSPQAGLPSDNFSVRWTRSPYFDSGRYRFYVRVDDGARLYVDDALIIDQWRDGSEREYTAERSLDAGWHSVRLEYYENTGGARIALWWERIGNRDDDDDDDDDDDFDDWKGEYYTNNDLDDDPRFRRNDEEIDFNWGDDSPDSRIPDDNFSVRWSQRIDFDRGRYRFDVRADDGIRVYIDGNRVLNEWHENDFDDGYSFELDLDHRHDVVVEYYERRGGARVYFDWDRIGDIVTATPTQTATPVATETPLPPTVTPTPVTPTAVPTDATPTWTPTVVQPSANIQPTTGGPGTTVIVNGGGFPANVVVNVHLGALIGVRSSATDLETYATTTTDRTGSYSVGFDLPATWPDGDAISSGEVLVLVATADFAAQASTVLNYTATAPTPTPTPTETATAAPTATGTLPPTPTATHTPLPTATPAETATPVPQPFVNLDPGAATAGTLIQVTGGGFPANTALDLYLGIFDGEISPNDSAVSFASTVTNDEGNYSMSFVMPDDTPTGVLIPSGRIAVVVATDGFALQAASTLDFTGVDPTPTPEPTTSGAAAGEEEVSGTDSQRAENGTIPQQND